MREEIYNIYTFLSTEMRNEAWKFCNFCGCQGSSKYQETFVGGGGGGGGDRVPKNIMVMVMVMVMVSLFRHGKSFSKDYREIKDKI